MSQGPGDAGADDDPFWDACRSYREQLDDSGFGDELIEPGSGPTTPLDGRLTALHELAGERFEQRALELSVRAESVDTYEQGAYADPPINSVMMVFLIPSTLVLAVAILLTNTLVVGVPFLVMCLALDAVFVSWWRRPPYIYSGEDRKPLDEAVALARKRASHARSELLRSTGTPCPTDET